MKMKIESSEYPIYFLFLLASAPNNQNKDYLRSNKTYLDSLGSTILGLCSAIPEGVLVFFASYAQLNSCTQHWKESGMMGRLEALKTLVVEPRGKADFTVAMMEFDSGVTKMGSRGAVFFAVCRGKVSEGIDFADRHGRGVILVGIPFPPMLDARVCLKRSYLDRLARADKSGKGLRGDEWYQMEAVRAVNQALGRVIRHKNDYGVVILAESRFASWDRNRFPGWIRDKIEIHPQFGACQSSVEKFFQQKRALSDTQSALAASTRATEASTSLAAVEVRKAALTDIYNQSAGIKRPRPVIEYEENVAPYRSIAAQKRPSYSGVFDALEDTECKEQATTSHSVEDWTPTRVEARKRPRIKMGACPRFYGPQTCCAK